MPPRDKGTGEERVPLTQTALEQGVSRPSTDSLVSDTTISTTSLVLEHITDPAPGTGARYASRSRSLSQAQLNGEKYRDDYGSDDTPRLEEFDIEEGKYAGPQQPVDRKARRLLWIVGAVCVVGWGLALLSFLLGGSYKHASSRPHDPFATVTKGSGKRITLDSVLNGQWYPERQDVQWIAGPEGQDGLLLKTGVRGKPYLVVEDIKNKDSAPSNYVLMRESTFDVRGQFVAPSKVWPSPDFMKVLVMSDEQKQWRHSFTGVYWIFDVETQTAEPLDPKNPLARVQLAAWSPQSNRIVFTRDNNLYLRNLDVEEVQPITTDGGSELFYGRPDWVYEEEVFQGNSATWWSDDGMHVAYLRTNESKVPTYPVQYFIERPSGKDPNPGEENYPEVRNIKYPKAGAPNPVVSLQFFDVEKNEIFTVDIENDFEDHDRLITEVVWAGRSKQVLIRETNRESDILKLLLIDVERRTGRTVRSENIAELDGGWMEVSHYTRFVPSDPAKGRNHDGYIDTVIHEGYDHLGYFTPMDNPTPILLTQGTWEVVNAPSALDLEKNLVYFTSTERSSMERHPYVVSLDGTNRREVMKGAAPGYYASHFSTSGSYALITYEGPGIPWQKLISTPSAPSPFAKTLEENKALERSVRQHEMPLLIYSEIEVDGFPLNVLERRPPHFNPKHKYPVLFYQYSGPGSQTVNKRFSVQFESYIASTLGYITVTVDPRGTGYQGRKHRCITRGNIGYYEAHDQIAVAKIYAKKPFIDASRLAIWGWSYGGFTTLKTLEMDAGRTFKYGMAVAPVTDWRFYDSIYTERYMHTPQHNPHGYDNSSISDVQALGSNVRFLLMHGVADDNVHMQNTLTLLDKLDLGGVENYDVHVFPDSDHSIYFHGANRVVYDSKYPLLLLWEMGHGGLRLTCAQN